MLNDLLTKFIDWKKNIQHVSVFELNVVYDFESSLRNNMEELLVLRSYHPNLGAVIDPDPALADVDHFDYGEDFYGSHHVFELREEIVAGHCPSYACGYIRNRRKRIAQVFVRQLSTLFPGDLLEKSLDLDPNHLRFAQLTNPHYATWTNQKELRFYRYRGGLKTIKSPVFSELEVDLSRRPGRRANLENFQFQGASDYWFGPAIFEVFPREHLLAFKQGQSIRELPNGIIHLELFDLDDYWSDDSQNRIRALREHLEIDRLAEEYRTALKG